MVSYEVSIGVIIVNVLLCVGSLNLKDIVGKKLFFYGAITFDRPDKIFITPIEIKEI